jgi:hypothetical protein
MRTLLLLSTLLLSSLPGFSQATIPGNAELSQVQTIYMLPMTSGFDQYLAVRLRGISQFRVVADPGKADAYFTDKIGPSLELRLDELDEAIQEKAEKAEKAKAGAATKGEEAERALTDVRVPKMLTTIGRGKGTYFLVDRRTRMVLWSLYEKPKDYQPKTLDATAAVVVKRLTEDLTGKKK